MHPLSVADAPKGIRHGEGTRRLLPTCDIPDWKQLFAYSAIPQRIPRSKGGNSAIFNGRCIHKQGKTTLTFSGQ